MMMMMDIKCGLCNDNDKIVNHIIKECQINDKVILYTIQPTVKISDDY